MGREVRMAPPGWSHPKDERGCYIPLFDFDYDECAATWDEGKARWDAGEVEDYSGASKWKPRTAEHGQSYEGWAGARPDPAHFMPKFADGTATHYFMYEDTSEGTPISPGFATPEELARWLADNGASAFAGQTASYEAWLATIKRGSAHSMTMDANGIRSGVEDLHSRAG